MTAISLDATPAANSLRTQFRRAVHSIGDTIDAFVAYRIQQILGEPYHDPAHRHDRSACPRRPHRSTVATIRNLRGAADLAAYSLTKRPERSAVPAGDVSLTSVDHRARNAILLRRPDPNALSASIPVFFIGRNSNGFWVARDETASIGGIFWFKDSALRFARRTTSPAGCALIFLSETFELDTENSGNPLFGLAVISEKLLRSLSAKKTNDRVSSLD